MAVEAHIRHEHTEYERLMEDKRVEREGARKKVWGDVKRIRNEWAGNIKDTPEEGDDSEVEEVEEEKKVKEVQEVEVIDLT